MIMPKSIPKKRSKEIMPATLSLEEEDLSSAVRTQLSALGATTSWVLTRLVMMESKKRLRRRTLLPREEESSRILVQQLLPKTRNLKKKRKRKNLPKDLDFSEKLRLVVVSKTRRPLVKTSLMTLV